MFKIDTIGEKIGRTGPQSGSPLYQNARGGENHIGMPQEPVLGFHNCLRKMVKETVIINPVEDKEVPVQAGEEMPQERSRGTTPEKDVIRARALKRLDEPVLEYSCVDAVSRRDAAQRQQGSSVDLQIIRMFSFLFPDPLCMAAQVTPYAGRISRAHRSKTNRLNVNDPLE